MKRRAQGQSGGRWSRPWSSPEWPTQLGGTKAVIGFGGREGASSLRNHMQGVDGQAAFGAVR